MRAKRRKGTPATPTVSVPPAPAGPAKPRLSMLEFWISIALIAATFLVYSPSFDHPYLNFDDRQYVEQNSHVHDGLGTEGVRYAFTTYDAANWHPLTWLSLELDASL